MLKQPQQPLLRPTLVSSLLAMLLALPISFAHASTDYASNQHSTRHPATATANHVIKDTIPLRFANGAISLTFTGKLLPKQDEHWYQFNASQGQYAVINISNYQPQGASEIANVGVLHFPNGGQDGTKGGIIYQGCVPQSGNYRLRIARNLMATHGGVAGYQVEVVILPHSASRELCP